MATLPEVASNDPFDDRSPVTRGRREHLNAGESLLHGWAENPSGLYATRGAREVLSRTGAGLPRRSEAPDLPRLVLDQESRWIASLTRRQGTVVSAGTGGRWLFLPAGWVFAAGRLVFLDRATRVSGPVTALLAFVLVYFVTSGAIIPAMSGLERRGPGATTSSTSISGRSKRVSPVGPALRIARSKVQSDWRQEKEGDRHLFSRLAAPLLGAQDVLSPVPAMGDVVGQSG